MENIFDMVENFGTMFSKAMEIIPQLTALDKETALAIVCMFFDEYARTHNENAVEMAKLVADLVKEVNEKMGEFK